MLSVACSVYLIKVFLCVKILPAHVCAPVCVSAHRGQKVVSESLELDLTIMSHRAGSGNGALQQE